MLKDKTQRMKVSNPGSLALESDALPLSHCTPKQMSCCIEQTQQFHGVQRRMISVDNFFVFFRLLFFALLLLYET